MTRPDYARDWCLNCSAECWHTLEGARNTCVGMALPVGEKPWDCRAGKQDHLCEHHDHDKDTAPTRRTLGAK